jgi:hypothetical protein
MSPAHAAANGQPPAMRRPHRVAFLQAVPPAMAAQVAVQLSRNWRPAHVESLPSVFTGGWVGYAGYDTVRYVYSGECPRPGCEHRMVLADDCLPAFVGSTCIGILFDLSFL